MWDTLQRDFPGVGVVNRGFGGSEIRDSTWYADRIVIPLAPRQVVLYAGDNDLHSGRGPTQLRDDFRDFVHRLRRDLPRVAIAYISTKPSPARAHLLPAQREANALIRDEAIRLHVAYIDLFTPMLDATGQPKDELFLPDRLHMNPAGYELWRETLAPYLDPANQARGNGLVTDRRLDFPSQPPGATPCRSTTFPRDTTPSPPI